MPNQIVNGPRLYLDAPLAAGRLVLLDRDQGNYLGNVLRLSTGGRVLVFNGRDGEWQAAIAGRKRPETLEILTQIRPQDRKPDLVYAFAPLKHARLDYLAQKATEMGASVLQPVLTRHTHVSRVNTDRMRANVIEAAEQCGILGVAVVKEPLALERWIADRETERLLVFCDETADVAAPIGVLSAAGGTDCGIDVLIGPEGGFSQQERALLSAQPRVLVLSLGPRILRADTAAVAALTLVQAVLGDWSAHPPSSKDPR